MVVNYDIIVMDCKADQGGMLLTLALDIRMNLGRFRCEVEEVDGILRPENDSEISSNKNKMECK